MPAATLHVTFADLLGRAAIPPRLAAAMQRQPRYAHLGAMLFDIPYYGNMAVMAIRYGLNRPAERRPWGLRIHVSGAAVPLYARFCARLRSADLADDVKLALCAGVGTHLALDAALHDLVHFCARRAARTRPGDESLHHRLAEKFHSLFFHLDHFGADIIGSPEWLERTRLTPAASLLWARHEEPVSRPWLAALRDCFGAAPSAREWAAWLRNFVQFGFLTSGWLARRNTRLVATDQMRRLYYSNELFHFPDHLEAATRLAERTLALAYAYYAAGRFDEAAQAQLAADLALPHDLAWPRATLVPCPYVVPPLPRRAVAPVAPWPARAPTRA